MKNDNGPLTNWQETSEDDGPAKVLGWIMAAVYTITVCLMILGGLLLTGCAHRGLPDPPTGELYTHNLPRGTATCSRIDSDSGCPALPISATDKFIMFHPQVWKRIINYIDELILRLETKGQQSGILLTANDLRILRRKMVAARDRSLRRP